MAHFPHSTIAGICGFIAGLLYRTDILHLKSLTFPTFLVDFCNRFIHPLVNSYQTSSIRRLENQSHQVIQIKKKEFFYHL